MALPRSLIPPNAERVSPEEYLRREAEAEFKSEYYDGYIVPLWPQGPNGMAGGSAAHTVLCSNLAVTLGPAVRAMGCRLLTSEVQVQRVDRDAFLYPDAAIVCQPEWKKTSAGILANPQMIFEVLSPSTEGRDRTTKFGMYSAIPSVIAIVFISSELRMVEVYTRHSESAWLREAYEEGSAHLPNDLSLGLSELYEDAPGVD